MGELALLVPAGRVLGARHATSMGAGPGTRSTGPGAGVRLLPVEHRIPVAPGVHLWAEERGDPARTPLLLVMGANASGLTWPEALVDRLA